MEQQCTYCEKPLGETEKVRWYSEHVHSECYDALLADTAAIIVIKQPAHDHNQEMPHGLPQLLRCSIRDAAVTLQRRIRLNFSCGAGIIRDGHRCILVYSKGAPASLAHACT